MPEAVSLPARQGDYIISNIPMRICCSILARGHRFGWNRHNRKTEWAASAHIRTFVAPQHLAKRQSFRETARNDGFGPNIATQVNHAGGLPEIRKKSRPGVSFRKRRSHNRRMSDGAARPSQCPSGGEGSKTGCDTGMILKIRRWKC